MQISIFLIADSLFIFSLHSQLDLAWPEYYSNRWKMAAPRGSRSGSGSESGKACSVKLQRLSIQDIYRLSCPSTPREERVTAKAVDEKFRKFEESGYDTLSTEYERMRRAWILHVEQNSREREEGFSLVMEGMLLQKAGELYGRQVEETRAYVEMVADKILGRSRRDEPESPSVGPERKKSKRKRTKKCECGRSIILEDGQEFGAELFCVTCTRAREVSQRNRTTEVLRIAEPSTPSSVQNSSLQGQEAAVTDQGIGDVPEPSGPTLQEPSPFSLVSQNSSVQPEAVPDHGMGEVPQPSVEPSPFSLVTQNSSVQQEEPSAIDSAQDELPTFEIGEPRPLRECLREPVVDRGNRRSTFGSRRKRKFRTRSVGGADVEYADPELEVDIPVPEDETEVNSLYDLLPFLRNFPNDGEGADIFVWISADGEITLCDSEDAVMQEQELVQQDPPNKRRRLRNADYTPRPIRVELSFVKTILTREVGGLELGEALRSLVNAASDLVEKEAVLSEEERQKLSEAPHFLRAWKQIVRPGLAKKLNKYACVPRLVFLHPQIRPLVKTFTDDLRNRVQRHIQVNLDDLESSIDGALQDDFADFNPHEMSTGPTQTDSFSDSVFESEIGSPLQSPLPRQQTTGHEHPSTPLTSSFQNISQDSGFEPDLSQSSQCP